MRMFLCTLTCALFCIAGQAQAQVATVKATEATMCGAKFAVHLDSSGSPLIGGWVGVETGSSGASMCLGVVVESVGSDRASLVLFNGDQPLWHLNKNATPYKAKVSGNTLEIITNNGNPMNLTFTGQAFELNARSVLSGYTYTGTLRKVP